MVLLCCVCGGCVLVWWAGDLSWCGLLVGVRVCECVVCFVLRWWGVLRLFCVVCCYVDA